MILGKTSGSGSATMNTLGQVYRCPVCGAELSVIRSGKGRLKPVCCNTEMVLLKVIHDVYVCSVCRSELMVVRGGKNLQPVCCNKKMHLVRSPML